MAPPQQAAEPEVVCEEGRRGRVLRSTPCRLCTDRRLPELAVVLLRVEIGAYAQRGREVGTLARL